MKKLIFTLFLLFSFSFVFAQNAADVETSFGPVPGFNGKILAIAQQPDGKILIGGEFTEYKGIACNYFVRLLPNGTVDPNFNLETTFWFKVNSIALQSDGKILVGAGYLTLVAGIKDGVIRLNSDGSTDYTYSTILGFSGITTINNILIQPDGKMILTGGFSSYGSVNIKYILRLNSDGSLDSTFNPGNSFNGSITSIALQADEKIIVVGYFSNYNGYTRNGIIRLNSDGSVDLTFSIGVGFSTGIPKSVLIQPDGKIVAAGNFNTYKNVTQNGVIRLLSNGDKDPTLNTGTGFYTSGEGITDIAMDNLGNFIVSGQFSKYNNIDKSNCVKLSPNGILDNTFTVFNAYNSSVIKCVLIQSDQKILLGGNFYISRINSVGSFDYSFDYGLGFGSQYGSPLVLNVTEIQPDGKIIVGGNFSLYNLRYEPGLIRLLPDGTKDNTFNVSYLDLGQTSGIILQPDGKIIVIGTYHYANVGPGNYLQVMRLNSDGSQDMTFSTTNIGANDVGYALQADGKILACGGFQVRRLNSNGTVDSTFNTGSGFNYYVKSIAVQPDGKIIVVGDFSIFNGEQHHGIVRLLPNGNIDTTFNTGEGFNGTARSISIQQDGKIIVGGYFGSYNVISAWGIVRINTDGSYDSTFNTGFSINNVNSLAIQTDGKIIAGGYKSYFVNSHLTNLIRFNVDGSVDTTFDIGTGFDMGDNNSYVSKLNLQPDGKILVSGSFKNYKSIGSNNLVRLYGGNSVLSNENYTNDKMVLYPNPTQDFMTIQLPSVNLNYDYEIMDLNGKLIIKKANTNSVIDVQTLSKGVYILKVKSETKDFVTKFIKE
jgi:uncharacterized delta-60 repeat protein